MLKKNKMTNLKEIASQLDSVVTDLVKATTSKLGDEFIYRSTFIIIKEES